MNLKKFVLKIVALNYYKNKALITKLNVQRPHSKNSYVGKNGNLSEPL